MAKTSKTVPKKDKASSSSASRPARPVVPPTLEEITPGPCIIKKDFSIENPPDVPGRCEHASRYISLITTKLVEDVKKDCDEAGSAQGKNQAFKSEVREGQKKKRVSKPEGPQDKKTPAQRLRKRFAQTGADSAHDSPDDEENDDEESALVTRTRKPIEVAKPSEPETSSRGEDAPKEETGKVPASPEVEIVPPSSTTIPEGVNAESPNVNENAPSEELGAATMGHSLSFPTYSEGAIEEANVLRMPDPNKIIEDNPFQGCYAGIEDANDLNHASSIFEEAQRLLSRDIVKIRAELSQCEAELKKVLGEEKSLRLLCSQKEEELKDLRTTLAKAQKSESELDEQARKIEGLEAELANARAEAAQAKAEAVQAKAKAEKTKAAADKSISIYLRETIAVQAELREASDRGRRSNELAKCRARRETLEEIHARGFNLAGEIAEAKARETDARFLVSSDNEDVVSGSGDEEGEEDVPEGDETPEDRSAGDVVSEDDTPGGVTSKID
ncbi:PREDICTED: MAP7 domain-containing protein 2-like [Nicotiana attenuata]|uniref:MAP7 domain-containing protein 2-like n=1 Tax=Nicotiana attenuata TaxID=49451 RepID=UPI000905925A|nr:PREDICTED: MAP7 domain-containing protein 2-like [Nicotiana attenuata]